MKEQPRMIYRSMQGKEVDMNKLINQNEMTVAVGNARVNARGDELGAGGKIIKKRDDVINTKSSTPAQNHSRMSNTYNIKNNNETIASTQNTIIRKKPQIKTAEDGE